MGNVLHNFQQFYSLLFSSMKNITFLCLQQEKRGFASFVYEDVCIILCESFVMCYKNYVEIWGMSAKNFWWFIPFLWLRNLFLVELKRQKTSNSFKNEKAKFLILRNFFSLSGHATVISYHQTFWNKSWLIAHYSMHLSQKYWVTSYCLFREICIQNVIFRLQFLLENLFCILFNLFIINTFNCLITIHSIDISRY